MIGAKQVLFSNSTQLKNMTPSTLGAHNDFIGLSMASRFFSREIISFNFISAAQNQKSETDAFFIHLVEVFHTNFHVFVEPIRITRMS